MARLEPYLLHNIPAFAGVETEQLRRVLDQAVMRRYKDGEALFRQGERADLFFLLLDGHVRVLRINEQGEQVIVLHVHPGRLLGIAPAFERPSYPATAEAAGEAVALGWPVALWPQFLAQMPGFASAALQTVGARVEEMNKRIMDLTTRPVEERVAGALLRLVDQTGRVDKDVNKDGLRIDFPLTRQNVADMTGATLHTVSRLLSAWGRQGILTGARRRVVVMDRDALERIAKGEGKTG